MCGRFTEVYTNEEGQRVSTPALCPSLAMIALVAQVYPIPNVVKEINSSLTVVRIV